MIHYPGETARAGMIAAAIHGEASEPLRELEPYRSDALDCDANCDDRFLNQTVVIPPHDFALLFIAGRRIEIADDGSAMRV
jgi:hypothetical protein